jgi:hypothetical protein
MANEGMKKWSTNVPLKEMQIKRTLRFHLTPVRMMMIKKTTNAGEDVGNWNPFTLWVGYKLLQQLWKSWCDSLKTTKNCVLLFLDTYAKEHNTNTPSKQEEKTYSLPYCHINTHLICNSRSFVFLVLGFELRTSRQAIYLLISPPAPQT